MARIDYAACIPLHEALQLYARLGWRIFPVFSLFTVGGDEFSDGIPTCECTKGAECGRPAKHPLFDQDGTSLFLKATSDLKQLYRWFYVPSHKQGGRTPYNIGVAHGPGSGTLALDVDPKNGGTETLLNLVKRYGPIPHTVKSVLSTNPDSHHLLFAWDKRLDGHEWWGALAPGIDVFAGSKGGSGYTIEPPSRHKSLGNRRWEASPHDTQLAPCPEWLVEWLLNRSAAEQAKREAAAARKEARKGLPQSEISKAIEAYKDQHTPKYPKHQSKCPICGSPDGFKVSKYDPQRWSCHSTRHAELAVGKEAKDGSWTGDVVDLHAFRVGLYSSKDPVESRVKFIRVIHQAMGVPMNPRKEGTGNA